MTASIRDDRNGEMRVFADLARLSEAAAERFVDLARRAIGARGRFVVALSGGHTPKLLYEILATKTYAKKVDWAHVEVFFADERCVPPDHPDSNYRMARLTLLEKIDIPPEKVHRIRGELYPADAARAYRDELRSALSDNERLDLILLGMGADGHTASLFPGGDALAENDADVVATYVKALHAWRVTLTLSTINSARNILFLVSGPEKAEGLKRVLSGDPLPAFLIRPDSGELMWYVDQEAAPLSRSMLGDEGRRGRCR